jgi:hypothetical protein
MKKLISKIKNRKWFAFAVFLTLFWGTAFILGIVWNAHYTIVERFYIPIALIGLLAMWGLGLEKQIFSKAFWCSFLFIDIIGNILCRIFDREYQIPLFWNIIIHSLDAVTTIPYYIGVIIYAFRSKQIWGEGEEKPIATSNEHTDYPHLKRARRKRKLKKFLLSLKPYVIATFIVLSMALMTLIVYNNRIVFPAAYQPEYPFIQPILKYRRTTITELQEFEQLFPNYLCDLYSHESPIATVDDKGYISYNSDPNSPFRFEMIAGVYNRYLLVMEIDMVSARLDPETEEVISAGSHNEPTFSLFEVDSVWAHFEIFFPRSAYGSTKKIKAFGINEWEKLVKAQGDFSALDIQLEKSSPIPNFGLAYRNNKMSNDIGVTN